MTDDRETSPVPKILLNDNVIAGLHEAIKMYDELIRIAMFSGSDEHIVMLYIRNDLSDLLLWLQKNKSW